MSTDKEPIHAYHVGEKGLKDIREAFEDIANQLEKQNRPASKQKNYSLHELTPVIRESRAQRRKRERQKRR